MCSSFIVCMFCLPSSAATYILLTTVTLVVRWAFLCKFFCYIITNNPFHVGPDSFLHPLSPKNVNKSSYETLCSFLNPRLRTNSRKLAAVNGYLCYRKMRGNRHIDLDHVRCTFGLSFKWCMSLGSTARQL